MTEYKILEDIIASGAHGTVKKAVHRTTHEMRAVKAINLADSHARMAFEAEYQAFSKLSCKVNNICQVEDILFSDDGKEAYLLMKHYDCDLFTYAFEMRNEVIPQQEIKILFYKICKGVRELHKAGIAHLDLKPENILIDLETGEPYICDFGSAFTSTSVKPKNRKTRARIQAIPALGKRGTRKFSSPEITLNPYFYDPFRADVYSLGLMLHSLVTGFHPSGRKKDGVIEYNFDWAKEIMEPECFDLLCCLTHPCPEKRCSIDAVFEHPWIKPKRRSIFSR